MAQALENANRDGQLEFFGDAGKAPFRRDPSRPGADRHTGSPLCAGCRAREARYGFQRRDDDPTTERPRTLCFECFRVELTHRQAVAARLARGWNAAQVSLPLEEKLSALRRRRGRAQIAARHALGL
jgi:hypothetical protein